MSESKTSLAPAIDPDCSLHFSPKGPPEKALLIGLLARAYWDLAPYVQAEHKKAAIMWFKSTDPQMDCRFTFIQVKELLELSSYELEKIKEAIKEAEKCELERLRIKHNVTISCSRCGPRETGCICVTEQLERDCVMAQNANDQAQKKGRLRLAGS